MPTTTITRYIAPGVGTKGTGATGYDVNPAPRTGQGPYGLVPGATGLPDPHADLAKLIPGLDSATGQASQNVIHELTGELPPDVISSIEDEGARYGVTSGMPGSTLARNRTAKNVGLTSLGLQRSGLQDYLGLTTGVKSNQTVPPALQAEIASNNANLNAAPDPAARAAELEAAFNRGRGGVPGAGGGFGGSIGAPNLSPSPGNPFGMGAPNTFPVASGNFHGTGGGGGGGGPTFTPGPAIYPGATGEPLDFTGGQNFDWENELFPTSAPTFDWENELFPTSGPSGFNIDDELFPTNAGNDLYDWEDELFPSNDADYADYE